MLHKKQTTLGMARLRIFTLCALTIFSFQSHALDAPAELVPGDLNPGDTFFVVFVTAGLIYACMSETTVFFDAFGASQAASGSQTSGVTGWRTLYAHNDGTNTTNAADAFGNVIDRPIYRTDEVRVADSRTDLFSGAIANPIDKDQNGATVNDQVFTGFDQFSSLFQPLASGNCQTGSSTATNSTWANLLTSTFLYDEALYVLSPLLTVPAASGVPASLPW